MRRAARPSHTEMNTRSKRRLEALSRRYPGKLELRVPHGATPVTLRSGVADPACAPPSCHEPPYRRSARAWRRRRH